MDCVTSLEDKNIIDREDLKQHDADSDFGMLEVKDIRVYHGPYSNLIFTLNRVGFVNENVNLEAQHYEKYLISRGMSNSFRKVRDIKG